MLNLSWLDGALCAGMDTNRFFPDYARAELPTIEYQDRGTDRRHVEIREVLAICNGCPVREACERYAITKGITDGIWGGRLAADRRKRPYVLADHDIPALG